MKLVDENITVIKIFFVGLMIGVVVAIAYVLIDKDNPAVNQSGNETYTYNDEINSIPLASRFPKGTIYFLDTGFDRSSMKFGVVPQQPKAEVAITNNSRQKLNLVLESAPERANVARLTVIDLGVSQTILLPQLGVYVFKDQDNPEHVITFEVVYDPNYE